VVTLGKAIPLQAQIDPEGCRSLRLLEVSENYYRQVTTLSALISGLLYPQGRSLVLFSVTGCIEIRAVARPEGLTQRETLAGIEPATFRLVAQYLNQLRYYVPRP
jgi:hypothetical protein